MQKLVLGMVAVICLDVGFAVYMSSVESGDMGVELLAVDAEAPIAAAAADGFVIERIPAVVDDAIAAGRSAIQTASLDERPSVIRTAHKKERAAPTQTVFRPTTTTIYYSTTTRAEYVTPSSPPPPMPASYTPKVTTLDGRRVPEKRSLVAAALPIVKKPYDLIRAIGSKLF